MKVTMVKYEKLKNLGNFQHEKVGIEVVLEETESPHFALKRAKDFVNNELDFVKPCCEEYEGAKQIIRQYEDDEIPF